MTLIKKEKSSLITVAYRHAFTTTGTTENVRNIGVVVWPFQKKAKINRCMIFARSVLSNTSTINVSSNVSFLESPASSYQNPVGQSVNPLISYPANPIVSIRNDMQTEFLNFYAFGFNVQNILFVRGGESAIGTEYDCFFEFEIVDEVFEEVY